MKLVHLIFIAFLSFSYSAHASLPLCGDGYSWFYSVFISNYRDFSYAYTFLYQAVDKDMNVNMAENCPATFDKYSMAKYLNEEFSVCESSCERHVKAFWSETWLFKESKIQKNLEECVSVCTQLRDGQRATLNNL